MSSLYGQNSQLWGTLEGVNGEVIIGKICPPASASTIYLSNHVFRCGRITALGGHGGQISVRRLDGMCPPSTILFFRMLDVADRCGHVFPYLNLQRPKLGIYIPDTTT
jgi:hypothetical protein